MCRKHFENRFEEARREAELERELMKATELKRDPNMRISNGIFPLLEELCQRVVNLEDSVASLKMKLGEFLYEAAKED